MKKPKNFEDGMARLDELLDKLSDETTPLESAIKLYSETAELMEYCSHTLEAAKLQMEEIDLKLHQTQDE